MLSRGIPWNMPLVTCILRINTRLKARVYTENTSDAWHIPRYPTRKHCMTSMYLFLIFNHEQLLYIVQNNPSSVGQQTKLSYV